MRKIGTELRSGRASGEKLEMTSGIKEHLAVHVRPIKGHLRQLAVAVAALLVVCPHGRSEEQDAELEVGVEERIERVPPKVEIEYTELLLRRTASAYERLQTYQDETRVTIRPAGRFGRTVEARYRLAVERPNKVAIERMPGMRVVCDGEKLHTYLFPLNKYEVEDAPKTMGGILEASPFGLGWQDGAPLKILSLFGNNPYKTMTESADEVEFIGDEVVGGTEVRHLVLHMEQSNTDLWTDVKTNLIKKIKIEPLQVAAASGARDVRMIFEEYHNRVQADAEIPRATFVFKPPEGAERTDDIVAELSGGMAQTSPLIGKAAPDFTLEGTGKTSSIRLSDFKGKVILLSFWTTECPGCRIEMPLLQGMYDEYKKRGATFIAVNAREDRRTVEEHIAKQRYTFPIALDADGRVGTLYKVEGFPTVILIDKSGTVRKVYAGYAQGFETRFKKELNRLLAE